MFRHLEMLNPSLLTSSPGGACVANLKHNCMAALGQILQLGTTRFTQTFLQFVSHQHQWEINNNTSDVKLYTGCPKKCLRYAQGPNQG